MSSVVHEKLLVELCFVCGYLHRGTVYEVARFKENLERCFSFNFEIVTGVTPIYFCNTCYRTVTFYEGRVKNGLPYKTTKVPVRWSEHVEENCGGCDMYNAAKKGGWRKKNKRKGRERTVGLWLDGKVPAVETFEQNLNVLDKVKLRFYNDDYQKCICVICNQLINGALMFKECHHGCCRSCFVQSFEKKVIDETCCPACGVKSTVVESSLHHAFVKALRVPCPNDCKAIVTVGNYKTHCDRCQPHHPDDKDDKELGDRLRKKLEESTTGTIKIKTGGQPLCFVKATQARVEASSASPSTIRNRSVEIEKFIAVESGVQKESVLLMKEAIMKRTSKEDRNKILTSLGLMKPMTEEEGLAMLANLNMTWYTYRAWGRWMRNFGFKPPSEKKMRVTMSSWLSGRTIECEMTPFQGKNGKKTTMISAPMAYVPNLTEFVLSYLDKLDDEGLMVHHPFMNGEIHIKIGGDHGVGSYKQSFQVCNVESPNSVQNTTVFCIFEAKDTKPNLKTSLLQYKDDIARLQNETWRGRKIRLFMFGDYQILYEMYGLSGASGTHNCLWCNTTSQQMSQATGNVRQEKRDLSKLIAAHDNFVNKFGNDLKQAKNNDVKNVIDAHYFNIELNQVVIPGLHITLGLFLKFFNLFELRCKELDYRLQHALDGTQENDALERVDRIESYIATLDEGLLGCANLYNWQMIQVAEGDDAERERLSEMYINHTNLVEEEKNRKLKELHDLKKANKMEVKGPTIKIIEGILHDKHVDRQAYHSNSFTGNHCHTMSKVVDHTLCECESTFKMVICHMFHCVECVENYTELCKAPVKMVLEHCPDNILLVSSAYDIKDKFTKLFSLFSRCHNMYDSKYEVNIKELETTIIELMTFWRNTWPHETVTPKMHLLEHHVLDFISEWKAGLGFYGEQGGESIHKEFHKLHNVHCGMRRDPIGRLTSMLNKHHISVNPHGRKQVPVPTKRPKKV